MPHKELEPYPFSGYVHMSPENRVRVRGTSFTSSELERMVEHFGNYTGVYASVSGDCVVLFNRPFKVYGD